jgi:type IV pilus assembly protein PilA
MIVVAIIGILAAVAIPAYQDYITRSKVSEGLNLAGAAKTQVSERYMTDGEMPTGNTSAGMPTATDISGNNVTSVTVLNSDPGTIEILYSDGSASDLNDATLHLVPNTAGGSVSWTCEPGGGDPIDPSFLPGSCS